MLEDTNSLDGAHLETLNEIGAPLSQVHRNHSRFISELIDCHRDKNTDLFYFLYSATYQSVFPPTSLRMSVFYERLSAI